mmetsp:Transcript_16266/g.25780  ORF Transcript_16266/g.25780 Transcript_16266/m.25780 type:complete len:306 (-) Transcript_16266:1949-2866(-)
MKSKFRFSANARSKNDSAAANSVSSRPTSTPIFRISESIFDGPKLRKKSITGVISPALDLLRLSPAFDALCALIMRRASLDSGKEKWGCLKKFVNSLESFSVDLSFSKIFGSRVGLSPLVVARKKGASAGFLGASVGLFRSLISSSFDRFIHREFGRPESVTMPGAFASTPAIVTESKRSFFLASFRCFSFSSTEDLSAFSDPAVGIAVIASTSSSVGFSGVPLRYTAPAYVLFAQRNIPTLLVCAVARKSPRGENAKETGAAENSSQSISRPDGISNIRMPPSIQLVASHLLSGENAISVTLFA